MADQIDAVKRLVARYRDEFSAKLTALAKEKFGEFSREARVDVAANEKLVAEVDVLEDKLSSARDRQNLFLGLMILGFIATGVGVVLAIENRQEDIQTVYNWLIVAGIGLLFGLVMWLPFRSSGKRATSLEDQIERKKAEGFTQMAPLNRLYTWDMMLKMIERTVPEIKFDPYLTEEKLEDLKSRPGWDFSFCDDKSMVFALSGTANGYPFAFGQYLEMEWGEYEYIGSEEVSWSEWERDSEGKREKVRRTSKIYAEIKKPIPVYTEKILLVYGEDDAATGQRKASMVLCENLKDASINTDPEPFRDWDYGLAKSFFVSYSEEYFKNMFIALSPLLAAPPQAYTEAATDGRGPKAASSWEHEALAQYLGEGRFQHPECKTRCIMKTKVLRRDDGESTVEVTAKGYRGVDHTTSKSVHGPDHRWHDVDVEWTEYFPVSGTGRMRLREGDSPTGEFSRRSIRVL
jgi:hypothetical protein